jgi:hypothetical protein
LTKTGTNTVDSSCIISSTNLKLNNTTGQIDAYGLQFLGDTTVPNGVSIEVAGGLLINTQINFRGTNVAVDTSKRGIAFRLDNRTGIQPFQWYVRDAGSSSETLVMSLYDNGTLALSNVVANGAIFTPSYERGDNAELVIKTGLSDSASAGSYITMRTASSSSTSPT